MKVFIDGEPIEKFANVTFISPSTEASIRQLLGPWFECMLIAKQGEEIRVDIFQKTPELLTQKEPFKCQECGKGYTDTMYDPCCSSICFGNYWSRT